jgi:hypothetical protein
MTGWICRSHGIKQERHTKFWRRTVFECGHMEDKEGEWKITATQTLGRQNVKMWGWMDLV